MTRRVGEADRVERLFEAASRLPAAERETFLDHACGDDAAVREEVSSLLRAEAQAGDFLRHLTRDPPAEPGPDFAPGRMIGPYQLRARIGEGGMSTVYLATRADDRYRKRVAIKLVPLALATDDHLRRFRTERHILASLDHPSIARLYDAGTTEEGLPYFVMEYVEGEPIDVYCDRRRLRVRERLELFRTVCAAVQYAHQNLVVHRDLKPSNLLVTADGAPKLLDFGIAKLLNPELASPTSQPTVTWHRVLTPAYASPEQVRGGTITTASDVYSLGALLYELLTGRVPHRLDGKTPSEIEAIVTGEEPERPSVAAVRPRTGDPDAGDARPSPEAVARARAVSPGELRRLLAGDLDNIVLRALRKAPQRRYVSAAELSEDLRRHLVGLPVRAREATFGYRAGRFLRRHRVAVAVASAFVALLVVSALGLGALALGRAEERDRKRLYAEVLEEILAVPDPNEGMGGRVTAEEILAHGAERVARLPDEQARLRADLQTTIGKVYSRLGKNAEAEPLLESALETRRRILGDRHEDVAQTLFYLGSLWLGTGDYEAAERAHREALALRRELLGDEHPDVANSLNHVALVARERGRYEESESLFRESLALRRRTHGEDDVEVARTVARLAGALGLQGKFDESERLYREALVRYRRSVGDDHLAVAETLNDLASILTSRGDRDEPEALLERALAIYRQRLGEDHMLVINVLNNLGAIAASRHDFEKAQGYYLDAYERARVTMGEDHPNLSFLLLGIGAVRMNLGDPAAAEPMLRRAVEIRRHNFGSDHFMTAKAKSFLGECLTDLGRYDEAGAMLEEAHAVIVAQDPPRARETERVARRLVALYEATGKEREAARYRTVLEEVSPPAGAAT